MPIVLNVAQVMQNPREQAPRMLQHVNIALLAPTPTQSVLVVRNNYCILPEVCDSWHPAVGLHTYWHG